MCSSDLVAAAGKPLLLAIRVYPAQQVTTIRLHYRRLNHLAKFETLETTPARGTFTIPGEHISAASDLMYYFEVLNTAKGGWFHPDPRTATPYFVVKVE